MNSRLEDLGEKLGNARKDRVQRSPIGGPGSPNLLKVLWPKPDFRSDVLTGGKNAAHSALFIAVYRNLATRPNSKMAFHDGSCSEIHYRRGVSFLRSLYEHETYTTLEALLKRFALYVDQQVAEGHPLSWPFAMGRNRGRKVSHPLFLGYELRFIAQNLSEWGWPYDQKIDDTDSYGAVQLKKDLSWRACVGNGRSADFLSSTAFTTKHDALAACAEALRAKIAERSAPEDVPRRRTQWARPRIGSVPTRIGPQLRDGSVSGRQFMETFGYRGVEFGSWMPDAERRVTLASCHDALIDLTTFLGLPPRFASLGSSLGIAFGSRGRGGINTAVAHFEPTHNILHFTRKRGAGALAHEFAHALDFYLGKAVFRMRATSISELAWGNVLSEANASPSSLEYVLCGPMKQLMRAMYGAPRVPTQYLLAAQALDATRSKWYWASPEEMFARAFEAWITDGLEERDQVNEFLVFGAGTASAEGWNLDHEPYPQGEERDAINEAMARVVFSAVRYWAAQRKAREEAVARA